MDLTEDERARLEALTRPGTAPVRKVAHTRALLLAADGHTDEQIASMTGRSRSLIERTRKRFVLGGVAVALWDKPRPGGAPKLDEHGRATLIALACANPPEGRTCWTMQLLADELIARHVVGSISDETVRRELKKNGLKPWLQEHWCIPEVSPAFVAAMEDVLDLYAEPYDPARPVVGFDERPLQLVAETRTPLPLAPGRPRRYDDEYRRNDTCTLFTTVEPLAGWRHVEVTERRTAIAVAHQLQWLVDVAYPDAQVIRIVLDNLNVHATSSLYVAFPAPEARRLAKKLAFHHTPSTAAGSTSPNASWLCWPPSA